MFINDIVEIVVANKLTITWIVIGWLLLYHLFVKPMHAKPYWGEAIRGIGESFIGSIAAIIMALLFHFAPGFIILLTLVFGFFFYTREMNKKMIGRPKVGIFVAIIYVAAIALFNYLFGYDFGYDFRRGIAQLTNSSFSEGTPKAGGHFWSGEDTLPVRHSGVRPSIDQPAEDSSFWPFSSSKRASASAGSTTKPNTEPAHGNKNKPNQAAAGGR